MRCTSKHKVHIYMQHMEYSRADGSAHVRGEVVHEHTLDPEEAVERHEVDVLHPIMSRMAPHHPGDAVSHLMCDAHIECSMQQGAPCPQGSETCLTCYAYQGHKCSKEYPYQVFGIPCSVLPRREPHGTRSMPYLIRMVPAPGLLRGHSSHIGIVHSCQAEHSQDQTILVTGRGGFKAS